MPEPLHGPLLDTDLDLGQVHAPQGLPQECLADVRDEIAEAVDVEDFAHQPPFLQLRLVHFETDRIVDLGPKASVGSSSDSHAAAGAKRSRPWNVEPTVPKKYCLAVSSRTSAFGSEARM